MTAIRYSGTMIGGGVWLVLVSVGLWQLAVYENTPGRAAARAESWPNNSQVSQDHALPTLVMVVHPHCPCTRASLSELGRVLGVCQGKVRTEVLFVLPESQPAGWEKTDLWTTAAALPGVQVQSDPGGREAARFGAQTSGQCFLFAASGQQLFAGGITSARGHEGSNAGSNALISLLRYGAKHKQAVGTPVFGCPLTSPIVEKIHGNPI